jgi:hypothetical protein
MFTIESDERNGFKYMTIFMNPKQRKLKFDNFNVITENEEVIGTMKKNILLYWAMV